MKERKISWESDISSTFDYKGKLYRCSFVRMELVAQLRNSHDFLMLRKEYMNSNAAWLARVGLI